MSSALATFTLEPGASLSQASPWHHAPVTLDSPALEVMTDLTRVKAATVAPDQSLHDAEQAMVYLGVRTLFVVERMPVLLGLITSTDLRGERAMRVVHERGVHHDELVVADVMTPLDGLDAIAFDRLGAASVGQLVLTLQRLGRNHLLVVEAAREGVPQRVRGIVSRAQIERQLGAPVDIADIASSFSEIERALV